MVNLPKAFYVCWVWGSLDPDRQDDNNFDTFHTPAGAAQRSSTKNKKAVKEHLFILFSSCHQCRFKCNVCIPQVSKIFFNSAH